MPPVVHRMSRLFYHNPKKGGVKTIPGSRWSPFKFDQAGWILKKGHMAKAGQSNGGHLSSAGQVLRFLVGIPSPGTLPHMRTMGTPATPVSAQGPLASRVTGDSCKSGAACLKPSRKDIGSGGILRCLRPKPAEIQQIEILTAARPRQLQFIQWKGK